MIDAAKKAHATIVDDKFHHFSPFGVSGVVVIAESHLAIHTWPEYRYAAVDVFTCGDTLKPEVAAIYLAQVFQSQNPSIHEIKRGIIGINNDKIAHKIEGEACLPGSSQDGKGIESNERSENLQVVY
jgi:S-adenosylmethionine decarboxylase